jgi:hypothetical protein
MGTNLNIQALARAIYARKEIIILDDSFSGLDAATENHIFHSLIGKDGFLRRSRSTIIMASSSGKFHLFWKLPVFEDALKANAFAARRLPYADHIIVLNSEGQITEQGQFGVLNSTGGYISSFGLMPPEWDYRPEQSSKSELPLVVNSSLTATKAEHSIEAEANKQTGDIAIYLYYIKSVGRLGALIFAIFISGFVFCISFPSEYFPFISRTIKAGSTL